MARISKEKSESLNFYKYISQRIGSEEVLRIRRLTFVISDIGQNETIVTSGSKGEGLNFHSSDLDIMFIDPCSKVYESETEVVMKGGRLSFIMNNDETQPCFTQLCLVTHPQNQTLVKVSDGVLNMLEKNHLGYMLSKEQYKQFMLLKRYQGKWSANIHGPCITDGDDNNDFAWCLKCDKWIALAKPWISRPRKTWPPPELISKIISSGVLFVPIGCEGSINENIEWRISFSVAEKILVFSFSHSQLLCYAMLKILLKEKVEKHEDLKGLLCSYFLKTLVFWRSEETDSYSWRPDDIIPRFRSCIQRLLYCVRYAILSHYFIPDNNLFFLRFNNNEKKLTTILKNAYIPGVHCFAYSDSLHDNQTITYSLISHYQRFIESVSTFSTIRFYGRVDRFARLLYEFLHHSKTNLSKGLFALQLSAAFMLVPEKTRYQNCAGNKYQYLMYKHDLSHLMIGLHSDAVSRLLMLASFFYVHRKYFAALTVITYTLKKCTDEKIDLSNEKIRLNHFQQYAVKLMKKEKLHTIMKSLTIQVFRFHLNSSVVPQEIQADVSSTPTLFDSLPFAHFLSFLCYYHLHDVTSCRQSLQRLEQAQWTLSNCGTTVYHPQSLNTVIMCGIGHQLISGTDIARHAFEEADKLDMYNVTSAASRLSSLI